MLIARRAKPTGIVQVASELRRRLLKGLRIEQQLSLFQTHQQTLAEWAPRLEGKRLLATDRFAWKFLKEVQILRTDLQQPRQPGQGIFHDLNLIADSVAQIWFPQMSPRPQARWLAAFSVRKLAHYHLSKDEIALSLVFDSLEVPREILQYLVYHELLHKEVGIAKVKGRHLAHTPAFKARERQFPGFGELEKKISLYLHGL